MTSKQRANTIYGKHFQIAMGCTNPKFRTSKIVKEHSISEVEAIIYTLERLPISPAVKWEWMHFREVLTILKNL